MGIADDLGRAVGLTERGTANLQRVDELLHRIVAGIKKASWHARDAPPTDAMAKALAADAKALHDVLDLSAENPWTAATLKRNLGKVKSFRKVLAQYAQVTTAEQLMTLVHSQATRSKDAVDKFFDWSRYASGLIGELDTEIDGVTSMAGFRVVLVTTKKAEWTDAIGDRLRWALEQTSQTLARMGYGSMSRSPIYAYPSAMLPLSATNSHSSLASYHPKRDSMNVAAGQEGSEQKLLHSLLHEHGHKVYFRLIEGRARVAWNEFFESNKGKPDLGDIIKRWEEFAPSEPDGNGRYLGYYLNHLRKLGENGKRDAMWIVLVADNIGIKEEFDAYTGRPKGKGLPGLDQLIAGKDKARVFLHPVTTYSGANAEELFAETFTEHGLRGIRRIPPLVRLIYKQTVPGLRESTALADQLQASLS